MRKFPFTIGHLGALWIVVNVILYTAIFVVITTTLIIENQWVFEHSFGYTMLAVFVFNAGVTLLLAVLIGGGYQIIYWIDKTIKSWKE